LYLPKIVTPYVPPVAVLIVAVMLQDVRPGLHEGALRVGGVNPEEATAVKVTAVLPRTGPPFSVVAVIVSALDPPTVVVSEELLDVTANQPHVVEHAELLKVVPVWICAGFGVGVPLAIVTQIPPETLDAAQPAGAITGTGPWKPTG
jgi:hypothetical protein